MGDVTTSLNALSYQQILVSPNIICVRFEGFHGSYYEEWRLLGCYAAWLL
jgi:hypothetical protein